MPLPHRSGNTLISQRADPKKLFALKGIQTLKKMDGFGKKEILLLPESEVGGDNVIVPLMAKKNFLDFSFVKDMFFL
jgi:hypothetical protein